MYWQKRKIINGVVFKECFKCKEWKPETEEYYYMQNKNKPERGFSSNCKECERKRARNYLKDNYNNMIDNISQWQKENREKTLSYMREHYQNNKEKRRKYVKEWINNNPEKAKEYQNKHRDHDITKTEWENCKRYFNYKCAYCGFPLSEHKLKRNNKIIMIDLHKEHVEDKGANDLRNCIPSCQSCNSIKNLKTINELLESGLIEKFTQERYNKIMLWLSEDYKQYIEEKPPYLIIRKQNEGLTTYSYYLWTVDDLRNPLECIGKAGKKKGLNKYIKENFPA